MPASWKSRSAPRSGAVDRSDGVEICQAPRGETLHARRPISLDQTLLQRNRRQLEPARAQRRDRSAGIVELMAAEQSGRGQIEQAVVVLIDEAPAFHRGRPLLPGGVQWRVRTHGFPLDDLERGIR